MNYLPDTNVLSRFLRGRSDDLPLRERLASRIGSCVLSAIVLMELEYGAAKRPDLPAYRTRVMQLRIAFPRVSAFDSHAAERAGQIRAFLANLKPNAQPIGPYDVLLAGQALALGATLVTGNTSEFGRVPGLAVESW